MLSFPSHCARCGHPFSISHVCPPAGAAKAVNDRAPVMTAPAQSGQRAGTWVPVASAFAAAQLLLPGIAKASPIDVSSVASGVVDTLGAVALVGLACLLIHAVIGGFRAARAVLGFGSSGSAPDRSLQSHMDRTAGFDGGYTRERFDQSWSDERKAAWREGVAARLEDARKRA